MHTNIAGIKCKGFFRMQTFFAALADKSGVTAEQTMAALSR
jgi:hypothetical protein